MQKSLGRGPGCQGNSDCTGSGDGAEGSCQVDLQAMENSSSVSDMLDELLMRNIPSSVV